MCERTSQLLWIVATPKVGLHIPKYFQIEGMTCVVVLLYLKLTVNGDPANNSCPSCLLHHDPKPNDLYACGPSHRVYSVTRACTHRGLQCGIIFVLPAGAFAWRRVSVSPLPGRCRGRRARSTGKRMGRLLPRSRPRPSPSPVACAVQSQKRKRAVILTGCSVTNGHAKQGKDKSLSRSHSK